MAPRKPAAKKKLAKKPVDQRDPRSVELGKTFGFQPGNAFWKARASHGVDKIFTSVVFLAEACQEYFDWVEANPLMEGKAFAYEGDISIGSVPKMRAMTVGSLCIFLGISRSTWYDYVKGNHGADYSDTCRSVEAVIREQKFGGAAAGLLNANIIGRDLGLVDKKEVSGPDGGPIQTITTEMTAQQAAEAYADTLRDIEP